MTKSDGPERVSVDEAKRLLEGLRYRLGGAVMAIEQQKEIWTGLSWFAAPLNNFYTSFGEAPLRIGPRANLELKGFEGAMLVELRGILRNELVDNYFPGRIRRTVTKIGSAYGAYSTRALIGGLVVTPDIKEALHMLANPDNGDMPERFSLLAKLSAYVERGGVEKCYERPLLVLPRYSKRASEAVVRWEEEGLGVRETSHWDFRLVHRREKVKEHPEFPENDDFLMLRREYRATK